LYCVLLRRTDGFHMEDGKTICMEQTREASPD
jgi:hypothetical protein